MKNNRLFGSMGRNKSSWFDFVDSGPVTDPATTDVYWLIWLVQSSWATERRECWATHLLMQWLLLPTIGSIPRRSLRLE